ncbi:MAG: hypothetical protein PWP76_357 [Candidatus Diapherotrites archaeon]|nr:hypothetical protein [Candidatus Diapherotrites archaeon]MDN5367218.1 hypothetical protein [Candidatus Diapherotrites archaeon]
MRFIFLGTGGGRFVMTKQLRRTAGFVVRSGETMVHVDPGPGAVVYLNKVVGDPGKLSAVLVSHAHLDHSHDVPVLVEGMADGGRKKRGILIGSSCAINGCQDFLPVIGEYHKAMLDQVIVAEPGQEFRIGDLKVYTTPTWHNEPSGVGFTFSDGKYTVSYLSDTGYTDELGRELKKLRPNAVIFNLIFDGEERVPHTNMDTVRSVLSEITPEIVLLQHFGAKITMRKMERALARRIEEEFGVKTVALRDGDVVDLPPKRDRTLEAFI